MIYVGIDPGQKGAIAFIKNNSIIIYDMPLFSNKEIDGIKTSDIFFTEGGDFCILEKAQTMPQQGTVSMFKYGMSYGIIKGVLYSFEISFQEVPPQKWKKEYSLSKDKAESIATAKKLFPDCKIDFRTCKGRMLDGRAEALLLAEYARRQYNND